MPATRLAFAIGAALTCLSSLAMASSPGAWAELHAKAKAACTKAANLNGATVRGEPIDFEDSVLLIIDGRHPQPHMKSARATKYCLHHKQTSKTQVSDAPVPIVSPVAKPVATGRTCWNQSFGAQLKTPRPIGTPCTAKNDEGDSYTGVVRR